MAGHGRIPSVRLLPPTLLRVTRGRRAAVAPKSFAPRILGRKGSDRLRPCASTSTSECCAVLGRYRRLMGSLRFPVSLMLGRLRAVRKYRGGGRQETHEPAPFP